MGIKAKNVMAKIAQSSTDTPNNLNGSIDERFWFLEAVLGDCLDGFVKVLFGVDCFAFDILLILWLNEFQVTKLRDFTLFF